MIIFHIKYSKEINNQLDKSYPEINEEIKEAKKDKITDLFSLEREGTDLTLTDEIKDTWVYIINQNRTENNFMKGTKQLWYNFSPGDIQNQEKINIFKRVLKVVQYYKEHNKAK